LFGVISGSYAFRSADDSGLGAQWATIGAGLGVLGALQPSGFELRLHLQLLADLLRASARDPVNGRDETASRWTPGIGAGLGVAWPVNRPVALLVGADGWTLWQSTAIRLAELQSATAPSFGTRIVLGAQLALP